MLPLKAVLLSATWKCLYNSSLACPWSCRDGLQQLVLHQDMSVYKSLFCICTYMSKESVLHLITFQISQYKPFIVLFSGLPPGFPYVVHLFFFSVENYCKVSRNSYLYFHSHHFRKISVLDQKITGVNHGNFFFKIKSVKRVTRSYGSSSKYT